MAPLPARITGVPPDALALALETAVPLWMIRLSLMSHAARLSVAQRDAGIIAAAVDELIPGCAMTVSQDVFSALARAVAFGALAPGGISVFGHHWCTDHATCPGGSLPARYRLP